MANRRTDGGRQTKAERKEQARRERLELQRTMARARRNRRIALALVFVLVPGVVAAFVLTRPETVSATPGELLRTAARAKQAAGCGPVEDVGPFQPEGQDRAHPGADGLPPLSSFASIPPASGPHGEVPLGAGVLGSPPPIDRLIHSLEHGAAIVWYAPDADGEELDALRDFFRSPDVGSRVIVAPYAYPDQGAAGRLPAGTRMALVSWHHVQRCEQVSLAAAFDFTASYAAPPFGERPYLGNAPEAGAAF
ncbi:MAG TPA: DUF3105 domain-containing protein [Actinomycetota bacterium]